MTTIDGLEVLRIAVLEQSPQDGGMWVVRVQSDDPFLLGFLYRKEPFWNPEVKQTDIMVGAWPCQVLEFVLRAHHRAPSLGNEHYWGPFVTGLCLDAVFFRFCLPPDVAERGLVAVMRENAGELEMYR